MEGNRQDKKEVGVVLVARLTAGSRVARGPGPILTGVGGPMRGREGTEKRRGGGVGVGKVAPKRTTRGGEEEKTRVKRGPPIPFRLAGSWAGLTEWPSSLSEAKPWDPQATTEKKAWWVCTRERERDRETERERDNDGGVCGGGPESVESSRPRSNKQPLGSFESTMLC